MEKSLDDLMLENYHDDIMGTFMDDIGELIDIVVDTEKEDNSIF